MNLTKKTDKQLRDILGKLRKADVFIQLEYDVEEEIIRREKEDNVMQIYNGLEAEKMTIELNWGEELRVFSVIIEDVDNESTNSYC